jgi:phage tail-like protein
MNAASPNDNDRRQWQPFPAFNFVVEIVRDDQSKALAGGAFSDCDGIEVSQEVKTLREGGNPNRVHRLAGPVAFGQLTLKRGVTHGFDLWQWFSDSLANPALRAGVTISVLRQRQAASGAASSSAVACRSNSRRRRSTRATARWRSRNCRSPTKRSAGRIKSNA